MAITSTIVGLVTMISTGLGSLPGVLNGGVEAGELISPVPIVQLAQAEAGEEILAERQLDLTTRHPDENINGVFADNILLAVWYFSGQSQPPESTRILDRIIVEVELGPGEVWAFHDMVLPEFKPEALETSGGSLIASGTRYTAKEGYRTALGLPGNGVCHLATLMNWVASEAGLEVTAKVNHNFAPVPGVPEKYGTSIRYSPDGSLNSANQNLYIKDNFDDPIRLIFTLEGSSLKLRIVR